MKALKANRIDSEVQDTYIDDIMFLNVNVTGYQKRC